MKKPTLVLLSALAVAALTLPAEGCKPKKMSQAAQCKKGCAYRLACIEELALDKAVTDANRSVVQQRQRQQRAGFLEFCENACKKGHRRLRGYATCGVKAKSCEAFFQCARQVEKAEKKPTPPAPKP